MMYILRFSLWFTAFILPVCFINYLRYSDQSQSPAFLQLRLFHFNSFFSSSTRIQSLEPTLARNKSGRAHGVIRSVINTLQWLFTQCLSMCVLRVYSRVRLCPLRRTLAWIACWSVSKKERCGTHLPTEQWDKETRRYCSTSSAYFACFIDF